MICQSSAIFGYIQYQEIILSYLKFCILYENFELNLQCNCLYYEIPGFFFLKKSFQSVVYNGGQEDVMYEGLWLSFRWIHENFHTNFHIFIYIYYIEVGKFTSSILNIVKYLCTYIGSKKQITKFYTKFYLQYIATL